MLRFGDSKWEIHMNKEKIIDALAIIESLVYAATQNLEIKRKSPNEVQEALRQLKEASQGGDTRLMGLCSNLEFLARNWGDFETTTRDMGSNNNTILGAVKEIQQYIKELPS